MLSASIEAVNRLDLTEPGGIRYGLRQHYPMVWHRMALNLSLLTVII